MTFAIGFLCGALVVVALFAVALVVGASQCHIH